MIENRKILPKLPFYLIIGSVFGFALWSIYFPLLGGKVDEVMAGVGSEGDPYTVCDSGCDYTSVDQALRDAIGDNKYIELRSPHNNSVSSTLDWSDQAQSPYISCQSTDIVFATGSEDFGLDLSASTTIDGCTIGQVSISSAGGGITIKNNIFATTSLHSVSNSTSTYNWTISNNVGIMRIDLNGAASGVSNGCINCIISGNTIQIVSSSNNGIAFSGIDDQVINNTFEIYQSDHQGTLVAISTTTNALFATNTFKYFTETLNSLHYPIVVGNSDGLQEITNLAIRGNLVIFPDQSSSVNIITLSSASTADFTANIQNNTFVTKGNNGIIYFNLFGSGTQAVSSSYNIFFSASSTGSSGKGFNFNSEISTSSLVYNDYNSFYNLIQNYNNPDNSAGTIGSNSITSNPFFTNTSTYAALADFSACLDVNGTLDIGHMSQVRDNNIPIGAIRTVKQFNTVSTTLRANDSVNFDAGYFDGFILGTSNITITGQGATTVFNADTNTNAIELSSANSCTLQDFVVQNASSTQSLYYADRIVVSYDGIIYDDDFEAGPTSTMLLTSVVSGCGDTAVITTDDFDVTGNSGIGTSNIHLVLANMMGMAYFPILVPDSIATSEAEFDSLDECGGGAISELWIDDAFTVSNGTYTLNSAAFSSAGVTFYTGFENPELSSDVFQYAGIKFTNSNSNTIQNVSSTENGYGVWFSGTSLNNNVSNTTFSNSSVYDVYSDSSASNTLKNVDFTVVSSSISGVGNVDVYYKIRGLVTSATSSNPITDIAVTFSRADENDSTILTSAELGYTPFSDYLFAFVMTSTSIATTNGGYNPWDVTVEAVDGYAAYSSTVTIDSQNETVSVALSGLSSAPPAPTDFSTSSVSTSSIAFTWTDNASGDDQEDNFILDYISGNDSDNFPGTVSNPSQDATSATITGLLPNTQYTFRLAATNGSGTSSYVTSSAMYTSADTPGTPAVSANGQTSLIVAWSANSNGSGTTYEVYNVTTGATAGTTTDTSLTVSGLTAGTSYQFKVRAQYLSDSSSYSSYSSNSTAVSTTAATSSSSGSGSVISPTPPVSPVILAPTMTNISVLFGKPQKVLVGNSSHTVTTFVLPAGNIIKIIIESDPITIELKKGEEKLVDTNKDKKDDLFVRVNNINDAYADLTIASVDDLEFSINQTLSTTSNREVTLYFNSPSAVMLAVSNDSSFSGVSYEPYVKNKKWTLSSENGEKTVYVKFRTSSGGEKVLSDTIILTGQKTVEDKCIVTPGKSYKQPNSPGVYYITDECTKRPISSTQKFFSYFTNWNEVITIDKTTLDSIPNDSLGFMPWGPNYDPKYGALVKTISDPKVYLLLGTEKYWITSETIFQALKYSWNWIEDVAMSLLNKYTTASEINYTGHHPNYTLIKYKNSSKVYRLEPKPDDQLGQVKRWVADETTFNSLFFRWDRIVTISDDEIYPDGNDLKTAISQESKNELDKVTSYQFVSFLSKGSAGEEVRQLQLKLKELGFFPEDVVTNGVFGLSTEQAVKDFQTENNIDPVGYIGPATREKLNKS